MGYERTDRRYRTARDCDRDAGDRYRRYNEDRGFFDRAGDEVRSWFGDEEAERRRRLDEIYDERYNRDRYEGGRYACYQPGGYSSPDGYPRWTRSNQSGDARRRYASGYSPYSPYYPGPGEDRQFGTGYGTHRTYGDAGYDDDDSWRTAEYRALYGRRGLALLAEGVPAEDAVRLLTSADAGRAARQLHVMDQEGRFAQFTGDDCVDWAGGLLGETCSCAGNMLAGPQVVAETVRAFEGNGQLPMSCGFTKDVTANQGRPGSGRHSPCCVRKLTALSEKPGSRKTPMFWAAAPWGSGPDSVQQAKPQGLRSQGAWSLPSFDRCHLPKYFD